MLSSLALPCLPNHEVVYTTKSEASVCIEAKWRLNVNDHQHHGRRHHHGQCPADLVLQDSSSLLMAAKAATSPHLSNLTTVLSFYGSRSSLFFFLRPVFSLDVAFDPQYNMTQIKKIHFIYIFKILLQDSEVSWRNSVLHRIWLHL